MTEAARQGAPVIGDYPAPTFPTVFADGVGSLTNSPSIVKFFLSRFEPDLAGTAPAKVQAFAQVIMPMEAFATTTLFFERALAGFVKQGFITQERLNEMRKVIDS